MTTEPRDDRDDPDGCHTHESVRWASRRADSGDWSPDLEDFTCRDVDGPTAWSVDP